MRTGEAGKVQHTEDPEEMMPLTWGSQTVRHAVGWWLWQSASPAPCPSRYELGHLWGLCTLEAERPKRSCFLWLPQVGDTALPLLVSGSVCERGRASFRTQADQVASMRCYVEMNGELAVEGAHWFAIEQSNTATEQYSAGRLHQEARPICCVTLGNALSISGPQLLHPQDEISNYVISGVLSSMQILLWISLCAS